MTYELNPLRKLLHWVIALMVIAMIPAGLIFTDFDNKPMIESLFGEGSFNQFFDLHKSMGFTVLGLMGVRLLLALLWPAPPYDPPLSAPFRILGGATHGLLYALLIVVPVLGWIGVSAFPAPLPVFSLFSAPAIAPPDKELSRYALDLHSLLAFTLAALATLHVGAGIFHRNVLKDTVFNRVSFGSGRAKRRAALEPAAPEDGAVEA
jgi:cytochrome b561